MTRAITPLLLAFLALFLSVPGWSSAQELNEPTIRRMLSEIDDAVSRRDADGVAKFLSNKLTVTVTIKGAGRAQKVTMNKSTYVDALRKTWAVAQEYRFSRNNVAIRFSGDMKAIVTADVSEVVRIQGQTIKSNANETAVIELTGGKPLFVSIVGTLQM